MRNGILEGAHDARWLAAARGCSHGECDALVLALTDVALWYAYEIALCPSSAGRDIAVDDDGHLVIALSDDVNGSGWFHYRRRASSDDAARQLVRAKFGDVVRVPLAAMLSERAVGS